LLLYQEDIRDLTYWATSPDEFALVTAAKVSANKVVLFFSFLIWEQNLGYVLTERQSSFVSLQIGIEDDKKRRADIEILKMIHFSSKRKRMSVIFRDPSGKVVIFCKGADSVIFERLSPQSEEMKKITAEHLYVNKFFSVSFFLNSI
jgi:magnesium-transporting ATPase (P-type)